MDRVKFIEGMNSSLKYTEEERVKILDESLQKVSHHTKSIVAMEEFAELTQQISKQLRGEGNQCGLLEEMADAYLCLYNLGKIYNISDELMWKAIDAKLQSEKERMR